MKTYNIQIATAVPMNANFASPALQLKNMYGYAIQAKWTGTPTGTFKLQASCDPLEINTMTEFVTPTHWTDIATSSYAVTAAGDYMWNVFDVMYNFVRLVYTDGSGGTSTAVISLAIFNGKGM